MEGNKEEGDCEEGDDDFKLELGGKLWQRAREESCAKRVDTTTSVKSQAREALVRHVRV